MSEQEHLDHCFLATTGELTRTKTASDESNCSSAQQSNQSLSTRDPKRRASRLQRGLTQVSNKRSNHHLASLQPALKFRNTLVLKHRTFVTKVASILIRRLGLPTSLKEELVAAGQIGLLEAAARFDPNSGVGFEKWAYLRVRGSIIDALRKQFILRGNGYRELKQFESAHLLRYEALQLEDPEHIKASERFAGFLRYIARLKVVHDLTWTGCITEEDGQALQEDPERKLAKKDARQQLMTIFNQLPDRERYVLAEFYFHGKSLGEIAEDMGVGSRSWICRIHLRGIERLRKALRYHDLTLGDIA